MNCNGCKHKKGSKCKLNECMYSEMELDLRNIYEKLSVIKNAYGKDIYKSEWYERIKEIAMELELDEGERNCSICTHYVLSENGEYYSCEKWECEFEEEE